MLDSLRENEKKYINETVEKYHEVNLQNLEAYKDKLTKQALARKERENVEASSGIANTNENKLDFVREEVFSREMGHDKCVERSTAIDEDTKYLTAQSSLCSSESIPNVQAESDNKNNFGGKYFLFNMGTTGRTTLRLNESDDGVPEYDTGTNYRQASSKRNNSPVDPNEVTNLPTSQLIDSDTEQKCDSVKYQQGSSNEDMDDDAMMQAVLFESLCSSRNEEQLNNEKSLKRKNGCDTDQEETDRDDSNSWYHQGSALTLAASTPSDDNSDSGISIQDDMANSNLDTTSTVGGVTEGEDEEDMEEVTEDQDVGEEEFGYFVAEEDEAMEVDLELLNEDSQQGPVENESSTTIVDKIFGGKTVRLTQCLNCRTISENYDNFFDFKLSFEDCSKGRNDIVNLESLINHTLKKQDLVGSEQYHCEVCTSKQDAEIHTALVKAPEYLILTQNRFIYNSSALQESKILTRVDFGEELQLPVRNLSELKNYIKLPRKRNAQKCQVSSKSLSSDAKKDSSRLTDAGLPDVPSCDAFVHDISAITKINPPDSQIISCDKCDGSISDKCYNCNARAMSSSMLIPPIAVLSQRDGVEGALKDVPVAVYSPDTPPHSPRKQYVREHSSLPSRLSPYLPTPSNLLPRTLQNDQLFSSTNEVKGASQFIPTTIHQSHSMCLPVSINPEIDLVKSSNFEISNSAPPNYSSLINKHCREIVPFALKTNDLASPVMQARSLSTLLSTSSDSNSSFFSKLRNGDNDSAGIEPSPENTLLGVSSNNDSQSKCPELSNESVTSSIFGESSTSDIWTLKKSGAMLCSSINNEYKNICGDSIHTVNSDNNNHFSSIIDGRSSTGVSSLDLANTSSPAIHHEHGNIDVYDAADTGISLTSATDITNNSQLVQANDTSSGTMDGDNALCSRDSSSSGVGSDSKSGSGGNSEPCTVCGPADNTNEDCDRISELVNYSDDVPFGGERERYALYAIVVHSGNISKAGHYYCYARSSSDAVVATRSTDASAAQSR